MTMQLQESERRWLRVLLILGTLTVAFLLLGLVTQILAFFSDVLLVFFLAWLLAFGLSPIVAALLRAMPGLPRAVAVLLTYVLVLGVITLVSLLVAGTLASSITTFVTNVPRLQANLPEILAPWQTFANGLGLQVNLVENAQGFIRNLGSLGGDLLRPLTDLALASLGIFGNLLLVVFLSLFMVVDRDRILAFFVRVVPPRYAEEMRLFEVSVARSFGGFLRGQALMGFIYAGVAAFTHLVLGLDFGPASAAVAGLLQAIPFFGPFLSWAPPVLVAILTNPGAAIPALVIMGIGWFFVMNVIQPRLLADAVGIHPIVVLGSVILGLKIAGIPGAVFGIPIAAVLSSFFFYYLNRSTGGRRDVTARAARRLEEREGRHVRVPAPPEVGAAPTEPASSDEPVRSDVPTPPSPEDARLLEGRP